MCNELFGWITGVCLALFLLGCNNNNQSKDATKQQDASRRTQDGIVGRDIERDPSLPPDIRCDTSSMEQTKHHTGIDIVIPVITPKEHQWLSNKLAAFQKETIRNFIETTRRDTVTEVAGYVQGWSMHIEPLCLYKTDSVVSFILKIAQGYTGMPSGFWYPVFNFDNRSGKEIRFADYFQLDTPSDTITWARLGSQANGTPVETTRRLLESDDDIAFGFDKENVYICIEKYRLYPHGITAIKKSAFAAVIRPAYR